MGIEFLFLCLLVFSAVVVERRKYSPPQVARMFGVGAAKVIGWIESGELKAIDIADGPKGRKRYLIDRDAIAEFERRRQVVPDQEPMPKLRRRAAGDVKEFF